MALFVENGRETDTQHTKGRQSNIIGSHTLSVAKCLFSQREKRQFTPSGSSLATDKLEFSAWGIGTPNLVLSDVHGYKWRYPHQKNVTSVFLRNREAKQYIKKMLNDLVIDHTWLNQLDVPSISSFFLLLMSLTVPMYVGWEKRRLFTQIVFPPWVHAYPKKYECQGFCSHPNPWPLTA